MSNKLISYIESISQSCSLLHVIDFSFLNPQSIKFRQKLTL